ncbi:MAG: glycine cleavage system aminomethyltransferase GcvT [Holophagales bacterium]|nr:glycine cleavage system aminomethyltransferase GcvT [Holophagales bacterium]MYG30444.1 glycine cleavage system aminomethyltransferase GcvT [Holophagales bacterium]MYI81490.1 glycine cleavage system aminomethyltransferase GcvT [Holophagales bacterium]
MARVLRTVLYRRHVESGARFGPFAGYEMPIQYQGVLAEHRAVRERAGMFDVSHMGEIRVWGPRALSLLQGLTPNDVGALAPGRAHYSALLTERGTFIDDLLVYCLDPEDYLLVVNAASRERDLELLQRAAAAEDGGVRVDDRSDETALIAVQGPRAAEIVADVVGAEAAELRYYSFLRDHPAEDQAQRLVSRTGYTGEDGFEIYTPPERAEDLWAELLERGRDVGLMPAGLGARDTLRLEAGMMLCGQDIDEETTPLEAGLSWIVKWKKGDFVGREALVRQRERGCRHRLVGFEVEGRGIARHGHRLTVRNAPDCTGPVTSGAFAPTLGRAIGIARVDCGGGPPPPGSAASVTVRGREIDCRIVKLPFYRRPKAGV